MGYEQIEPKEQWGVHDAIQALNELERNVIHFMEHTLQTMSQPRQIITPFGESVITDEVDHPLGETLGRIRAMREGCFKQYGKEQWEQAMLFNENFGETDG